MKIVKKPLQLYSLQFAFPKGTTEETIDKFQDALESWNDNQNGGDWFDLEYDPDAVEPVCDLDLALTEGQVADLENYLKGKGL